MICMHVHNIGIHVDTRECEILLGYKAKEVLADIIVLIRSLVCTGGPDTVRLPARLYVAITARLHALLNLHVPLDSPQRINVSPT